MNRVFLIGYMASGKTTLGAAVAARLGAPWRFIDMDAEIERRTGASVAEIFARQGECAFRTMENDLLDELCRDDRVIVGCGGGTPMLSGAMERMNTAGSTVLLEASDARTLLRMRLAPPSQRPLIAGMDDEELLRYIVHNKALREPFYTLAQHRVCAEHLENAREIRSAADALITTLKLMPCNPK